MPAWDEAAVERLARRLSLRLDPARRRRHGGAMLGAGPGASLEFHDHRDYQPGDDLRHIDWGVYARTDQLVLRRHRREVSPRTEIVLDLSRSMAHGPAKAALGAAIAALLGRLTLAAGGRPSLWVLGAAARRLGRDWRAELRAAPCDGIAGLELTPPPALSPGSERLLVSDGLCPGGGRAAARRLGRAARSITLIEVLTRAERDPQPLGAVRLEDVEGGAVDLVHDVEVCRRYRERLARHQDEWRAALAGRGAGLVTCAVEDDLDGAARAMLGAGLLDARA